MLDEHINLLIICVRWSISDTEKLLAKRSWVHASFSVGYISILLSSWRVIHFEASSFSSQRQTMTTESSFILLCERRPPERPSLLSLNQGQPSLFRTEAARCWWWGDPDETEAEMRGVKAWWHLGYGGNRPRWRPFLPWPRAWLSSSLSPVDV